METREDEREALVNRMADDPNSNSCPTVFVSKSFIEKDLEELPINQLTYPVNLTMDNEYIFRITRGGKDTNKRQKKDSPWIAPLSNEKDPITVIIFDETPLRCIWDSGSKLFSYFVIYIE